MQLQRGPELTPFDNIDINGVFDLSDCGIEMCERSLVPSFMIRSWWDLDSPGDRNNFPVRRHLGIRIPATITIAAQNSLDLNSGWNPSHLRTKASTSPPVW